jgi:hypothetical protein
MSRIYKHNQSIGLLTFVLRRTRIVLAERSVRASDRDARPLGPSGSISRRHRERALEIDPGPARILLELADHF